MSVTIVCKRTVSVCQAYLSLTKYRSRELVLVLVLVVVLIRGCLSVTVTEQNSCGNIGPLLDAEAQWNEDEHDDEYESPTS